MNRKIISLNRKAVVISINENIYDEEWMNRLLNGESEQYGSHKVSSAYRKMPVFFHYTGEGIGWRGEVLEPKDGFPTIWKTEETRNLVDINEMKKIGVAPPITIRYINPRQFKILDSLTR